MNKAILIWETRTGATSAIALEIDDVLKQSGIELISKRLSNARDDGFDLIGAMKDVDAVILGCPTYHHDLIQEVKDFLFEMGKADLKGKIGASFGSYGWTGESVGKITATMKNALRMDVIEPGLKIVERPSGDSLEECRKFGRSIAEKIKSKNKK
jgi:flavorubredoxin